MQKQANFSKECKALGVKSTKICARCHPHPLRLYSLAYLTEGLDWVFLFANRLHDEGALEQMLRDADAPLPLEPDRPLL